MINYCPCCSGLLLPHIRVSGFAWFCRRCWQDMPVYNRLTSGLPEQVMTEKTADKIHNRDNQIFFTSKGKTITGWIGVQDLPV
ncbi:hypothetical protein NWP17_06935 [Chrysosporum bergii ANA360D]|uniref:Uncharacterized protein n=1 Tax=Chrysosporum bergii ANA360D TaxID=617107 RepID=A0AA43GRA1_9CYAN|nr:hypothetical protein [Chrysosporum bergii]MDH6060172.1 hypothetical protein [Chrysosporum bergii ANA360D]